MVSEEVTGSGPGQAESPDREKALLLSEIQRLEHVTATQRDLLLKLEATEENERAALGNAVHDDPLQLVVAAMLRLEVLAAKLPEPASTAAGGIADILESASGQLRNLVTVLMPVDLSGGIRPALEGVAKSFFLETDTIFDLTGPQHVILEAHRKDYVYRIMREAIINVRKHANATSARLEIFDDDDEIVFTLVDDGVGFDVPVVVPGHVGLALMQARAAAIDADLMVRGEIDGGTTVRLAVPRVAHDPTRSSGIAGDLNPSAFLDPSRFAGQGV